MRFTPSETAENGSKCASFWCAKIRAIVVFPVPGGPHKTKEIIPSEAMSFEMVLEDALVRKFQEVIGDEVVLQWCGLLCHLRKKNPSCILQTYCILVFSCGKEKCFLRFSEIIRIIFLFLFYAYFNYWWGWFVGHHFVEHFLRTTDAEIIVFDKLNYVALGFDRLRDIEAYDDRRVTVLCADFSHPLTVGVRQEIGEVEYVFPSWGGKPCRSFHL